MEKKFFIFDLDNTLCNTFNTWGKAFDEALKEVCIENTLNRSEIEKQIMENIPENIKTIPGVKAGKDLRLTFSWTPSIKDTDCEEIIKTWRENHKTSVFASARKLLETTHKAGAKNIIYTDASQTNCLNEIALTDFPIEHIDLIFTLPDKDLKGQNTAFPIRDEAKELKKKLGSNLKTLPAGTKKPNAPAMDIILNTLGNPALEDIVFIGDNIKTDGEAAYITEIDFVLINPAFPPSTTAIYMHKIFGYRPPPVSLEKPDITELCDEGFPALVIDRDFMEIIKHYKPVKTV